MRNAPQQIPTTWQGEVLLACRKCQKKLKRIADLHSLARLKKTVKRLNKVHPGQPLHLINIGCMDACPKDAVAVCCPSRDPGHLGILRSERELENLYRP